MLIYFYAMQIIDIMKFYLSKGKVWNLLLSQKVLFFDDNKVKIARKPGKKQKENPVGYTGEGKR